MSLLDELQEQARELKDKRDVAAVLGRAENALSEERLRPRMQAAYRYFQTLIESVRVIEPAISMQCGLPGFGVVGNLKPDNYRIWLDTPDEISTFSFGYDCVSTSRVECQLNDKVAEQVRKTLADENIRCTIQNCRAGVLRLILTPRIPVRFELHADPAHELVRLRVRNLESLGTVEYTYSPERVTEELLEELGKRILNRPNRFKTLSGDVIESASRDALKSEIARDQRRKKAELGGPLSKLWWSLGERVRKLAGKA